MATFTTSQEWLNQCSLLVEARPQTTRITCRYSVKPKPPRRVKKTKSKDGDETLPDAPPSKTSAAPTQNPRAKLTLKAIDPASGVCLRYQTTKAAEVSRLVQLLGQLSRRQAGLAAAAAEAAAAEDVAMADADATPAASTPAATAQTPAASNPGGKAKQGQQGGGQQQQQSGGGGGKGKKKKGKR